MCVIVAYHNSLRNITMVKTLVFLMLCKCYMTMMISRYITLRNYNTKQYDHVLVYELDV